MATLTTTITENLVINGSLRGTTNAVAIDGINDVLERVVTCVHSQETTIAVFATQPFTSPGAIDVDRTKYVRVTHLDPSGLLEPIELAVVTTASNYQVTIPTGQSHIICLGSASVLAEADTTPSFGTMQDLTALIVKPTSTEANSQVELFVGVA